jgi:hypothetical protein
MKTVELGDEAFAALARFAAAKNLTPADLITAMVQGDRAPVGGDRLLFHLASREFAAIPDPAGRYLALLAWVARNHAQDFSDFISHQESARRYLMLGREEVQEIRARNRARQVPGTQFWAVMAVDDTTKARFVRRLLEFVGCHDETVQAALKELGLPPQEPGMFRLLSVA